MGVSLTTLKTVFVTTFTDIANLMGAQGLLGGIQFVDAAVTAFIQKLTSISTGEMFTIPGWLNELMAWVWPEFIAFPDWLSPLYTWKWPEFIAFPDWLSPLYTWTWPEFITMPDWIGSLTTWRWPSFPSLPGAWQAAIDFFNRGGGTDPDGTDTTTSSGSIGPNGAAGVGATNAVGTSNWRGGLTWVGETGPEIVNLPARTQIFSNSQSMAMVGGGGGGVYVTIQNVNVADNIDVERLAYRLADVIQSRRR